MIILSPSPSPGLDIDREMELIQKMKDVNGLYESNIEGHGGFQRQSIDILNLQASHRQVDGVDLLNMIKDDDGDQIVMEQHHYDWLISIILSLISNHYLTTRSRSWLISFSNIVIALDVPCSLYILYIQLLTLG